jgi:hypothetical protein
MNKSVGFVMFFCFFFSINASAALIDRGTYTTDTNSSLDWLDVTETAGNSYNAMLNGADGRLSSGWRFATGAEVRDLLSAYIGTGPEDYYYTEQAYINASTIIRLLGVSLSFNNNEGINTFYGYWEPTQIVATGYFDDGTTNSTVGLAAITAKAADASPGPDLGHGARWVVYDDFWYAPNLVPTSGYGSFLVRNSVAAIPEPAVLLLVGLGLFPLIISRTERTRLSRPAICRPS